MKPFPEILPEERLARLKPPRGPVKMVLDTDTYNEIDDQFALAYALLSPGITVEAVYAAPFHNSRSTGPADGMEKSYQEILRVLDRLNVVGEVLVFRGSDRYLPSASEPVCSPATEHLVELALSYLDEPLYVATIGCITNIASAILIEPAIIKNIVIIWLGGDPCSWPRPNARAFNLVQDTAAAQVIFDSGAPLVHMPCKNVSEHLRSTLPEMRKYVKGRGALGDYLYGIFEAYFDDHFARSKVIWDIIAIAYLVNPDWVPSELCRSPIIQEDLTWAPVDESRHMIREAYDVDRDAVFADLFRKLENACSSSQPT
ncbi:MAG: nucleoside hydrolase [Anaerolineae bacterium]|nr:nucleoside hydrolase [Anaerolineae bacterium]